MAIISTLRTDSETKVYPKTKISAIFNDDNVNLQDILDNLGDLENDGILTGGDGSTAGDPIDDVNATAAAMMMARSENNEELSLGYMQQEVNDINYKLGEEPLVTEAQTVNGAINSIALNQVSFSSEENDEEDTDDITL